MLLKDTIPKAQTHLLPAACRGRQGLTKVTMAFGVNIQGSGLRWIQDGSTHCLLWETHFGEEHTKSLLQNKPPESRDSCKIQKAGVAALTRPPLDTSHQPKLLGLPLLPQLSSLGTSGSACTSAGNSIRLFLCPWDPASACAYEPTVTLHPCVSTHLPGTGFESRS